MKAIERLTNGEQDAVNALLVNLERKDMQNIAQSVKNYLTEQGVETPIVEGSPAPKLIIEKSYTDILNALGMDLKDDSLRDTPKRVAKMFVDEIFYGLDYENFPKITVIENKMKCAEMVLIKDIKVSSFCEHHFVTIDGLATVAYIPNDKIIGLSKINRIVDFFSRRPQVQERLTMQIYHALEIILGTKNIAVSINAVHHCVKTRGVQDANSSTITNKLGGVFFDQAETRQEFMQYVRIN
jgi:GTP cyclohydrolase I